MQVPLQITLKDIARTEAIEHRIREKVTKLEVICHNIISCHVVAELTKRHPHQGKLYNVRIHLNLPGKELVVNQNEGKDFYNALRDAFEDMYRQLENVERIRDRHVKTHAVLSRGTVVRIFKDKQFGFIADGNGNEFYFNENSVLHPEFEQLAVGVSVEFIEMMGEDGAVANRISVIE